MKNFKFAAIFAGLLLSVYTATAHCSVTQFVEYDPITNSGICYMLPYVAQGQLRPTYGTIEATTVTYDSVIIRRSEPSAPFFVDIDTLVNLGTYNQANDTLRIDCSKWDDGIYCIITISDIVTSDFDCFPLQHYRNEAIFRYTKTHDTQLHETYTSSVPFELASNVVQNSLEIVWNNSFEPSNGYIYSVSGQMLHRFEAQTPHESVDVGTLQQGLYILTLQNKYGRNSVWFKKVQ